MHRSLVGETKLIHDAFYRFFDVRPIPGDGMTNRGSQFLAPLSWLLRPLVLEYDRASLEYWGQVIAAQRVPRRDRSATFPRPRPGPWHLLPDSIMPNLASAVDRGDAWEARESLARLAVAIERYRTAEGHPPEALAALVPAYLDTVPNDPFGGGAPFVYQRTADGWCLAAGDACHALDLGAWGDPVMEFGRPAPNPPKG
jgi:hypothetical protein